MKTFNKILIGAGIILFLLVVAGPAWGLVKKLTHINPNNEQVYIDQNGNVYLHYKTEEEQSLGKASNEFVNYAGDVVGSKSGTTTTGVNFSVTSTGGQSATTSYIKKTGGIQDIAIYTIKVLEATSSNANLNFSFLGSNDYECETASTTSSIDAITVPDINWFDVSDHLKDRVHSTAFSSATTTFSWINPVSESGKVIILEDLSYECLRLDMSGSSTVAWIQLKLK